jgi:hypothetical protein
MNYTIVILGVVVIILLYLLYKYFSTSSTSLTTKASLNNGVVSLPMPSTAGSANYSYNVWVCVNTWNSNSLKTIFYRPPGSGSKTDPLAGKSTTGSTALPLMSGSAKSPDDPQIILYLDKTTPTLFCYIQQTGSTDQIGPIPITTNFPLQSWVYVSISVQSTYLDLYLQGKLVKSIQFKAVPSLPDTDKPVYLGGSVDANVVGFKYYPNSLNPQQVWSNYMAGNGQSALSGLSSYGMNVNLTTNGTVQNTYKLF